MLVAEKEEVSAGFRPGRSRSLPYHSTSSTRPIDMMLLVLLAIPAAAAMRVMTMSDRPIVTIGREL
jgi:hypothetical protein